MHQLQASVSNSAPGLEAQILCLPLLTVTAFAVLLTVLTAGAAAGTGTGVAGMAGGGGDGDGFRRASAEAAAACCSDRSAVQTLDKLNSTSACSRRSTCCNRKAGDGTLQTSTLFRHQAQGAKSLLWQVKWHGLSILLLAE